MLAAASAWVIFWAVHRFDYYFCHCAGDGRGYLLLRRGDDPYASAPDSGHPCHDRQPGLRCPGDFGGFAGSAVVIGVKRGLFSNEAGMGEVPNALPLRQRCPIL